MVRTLTFVGWMCGIAACMSAVPAPVPATAGQPFPSSWPRGTVIFCSEQGTLVDNRTLAALAHAKADIGITWVAIQYMWKMPSATANVVTVGSSTPTTAEFESFIGHAHDAGIEVFLKPIVVAKGGVIMPDLDPSDPEKWGASYEQLIVPTAQMAQRLGVGALSVALELQKIMPNEALWRGIIAKVRAVYPDGKLTYASNPLTDETSNVPFWDALDFIGVDPYFPFVSPLKPNASLIVTKAQMEQMFSFFLDRNLLTWYNQSGLKQKMWVTEFGYPSSNKGMQTPWLMPPKGAGCTGDQAPNMTAQAAGYEVALAGFAAHPEAFAGVFSFRWAIPGNADYYGDRNAAGSQWGCGWTCEGKAGTVEALRSAFA